MYSVQIDIPYWNELHAGSVGALSSFTDNTPLSSVDNSLVNMLDWFTRGNQTRNVNTFAQDRITNSRDWERIIREGQREAERTSGGTTPDSQRRFPDTGGIPGSPPINSEQSPLERINEIMRGGPISQKDTSATNDKSDCGTFDLGCQLENFLTGDIAQRTGLILLAVLLIAIAIISLR